MDTSPRQVDQRPHTALRLRRGEWKLAGSWQYVAANIPLVIAIFAFPRYHTFLWGSMGLGSTAAIVVGAFRNRPSRKSPWLIVALAQLAFITGDITYDVLTKFLHESNPFPSLADAFYLATYPLFAVGVFGMVRARRRERDVGALLDALVVTTALALVSWIYLIQPYVHAQHLTVFSKAVSIAYPLGDILILSMLARLLFAGQLRNVSIALLSTGGIGLLVADSIYGWIQLHGNWSVGGPTDLGWVVFYVLWGAAALHPSMRALTEKQPPRYRQLSPMALVVLSTATLLAPGLNMGRRLAGANRGDIVLISSVAALMFVLVMLRLTGLARRQAVLAHREHVLREVGDRLLGTTELDAVFAVSVAAVEAIVGKAARACLITQVDGPDERVVKSWPSTLEASSVVVAQSATSSESADVRFPGGVTVGTIGYDTRWTAIPLAAVQGSSRRILVAHGDVLSFDTLAILEAVAAQISLAIERVELARALHERRGEARFRSLVQRASDVILVVRANGVLTAETPSVTSVLGYAPEAVAMMTVGELFHPDDTSQCLTLLESMMSGHRVGVRAEWRVHHADGRWLVMEVIAEDLSDDVNVAGVALTLRDVTDRKRLEGELRHRAFHDDLTNLANRELFNDRAQNALSRSERQQTSVAVLLLDVDDFKLVNDTFGHAAGDELLVQVATRLTELLRDGDTAARLGGDEFAICAEFDGTRPADVTSLAQRVLAAFAEPFTVTDTEVNSSATVGIAVQAATSEHDAADLLRQADLALYAAKNAGKRTFRFFEPSLHDAVLKRLEHRSALERAITQGQLVVHYQPIVELTDGRIAGVEALVRWDHPERGTLPPSEFIPIAEESGLIISLGRWVLDQACADLSRWRTKVRDACEMGMSVNVSPRQLHAEDFVEMVDGILREHRLGPESLTLEITESALLEGDDAILFRLQALQQRGITLALDDFGTGYSSLSYLHQFPLSTIKIDRAFVRDMDIGNGMALLDTIVSMGRNLGLSEVAEGIELSSQASQLELLGCRYGQGFLFARPMPADALEALLERPVAGVASVSPISDFPDIASRRQGVDAPLPATGNPIQRVSTEARAHDGEER
jgi:diguanylate cyclase (GGDEF)-like protein/PAS domain S-box-containing protein